MGLLDRIFYGSDESRRAGRAAALRQAHAARSAAAFRRQAAHAEGVRLSSLDPLVASSGGVYRHPVLQLTERMRGEGLLHDVQLLVFEAMREYSPTLNAAIRNRRTLEGTLYAESEDEGLAAALNEFIAGVRVGYLAGRATLRGLNTYLNMLAENSDEYGLGVGEIQTDRAGRTLERLVVPHARTLFTRALYRSEEGPGATGRAEVEAYGLFQRQERAAERRIDTEPFVQVTTFSYSARSAWPAPLAWGLAKSTEAVLRMYESVINGWWRFGDPSLLLGIEYTAEEGPPAMTSEPLAEGSSETVEVPQDLVMFRGSIEAIMHARRKGMVGDAYVYTTAGGRVINQVLGAVDATLMRYFTEQQSVFDSHIVAASRTPVWMYPSVIPGRSGGLGGEQAAQENLLAAIDARKRNEEKVRLAYEVCDAFLLLSGDARFTGRYLLETDVVNILDDEAEARARLRRAEAEAAIIENVVQAWDEEGNRRFAGEAEQYLIREEIYRDV
jgi:hypothetical protein